MDTGRTVHCLYDVQDTPGQMLAETLAEGLGYVSASPYPEPLAALQYFMTPGLRRERVSPVEAVLFDPEFHTEAAPQIPPNLLDVDQFTCLTEGVEQLLRAHEVHAVKRFRPAALTAVKPGSLRIGVFAPRNENAGSQRRLLESVKDLQDVEWHFYGEVFAPAAAGHWAADPAAFFRHVDYVVVPALTSRELNAAAEAFVWDRPVFAPPCDFAQGAHHIPVEMRSPGALRKALEKVLQSRRQCRKRLTEEAHREWIEGHDALFCKLLGGLPPDDEAGAAPTAAKIVVWTPAQKKREAPDEPVERLAQGLQTLLRDEGMRPIRGHTGEMPLDGAQACILLNAGYDLQTAKLLLHAHACDTPAKIHLHVQQCRRLWQCPEEHEQLAGRVHALDRAAGFVAQVSEPARDYAWQGGLRRALEADPWVLYCREAIACAAGCLVTSETERERLEDAGLLPAGAAVLRFSHGCLTAAGPLDAAPFGEIHGLQDYALFEGVLNPAGNALALLCAAARCGMPAVFLYEEPAKTDSYYREMVQNLAPPDALFVPRRSLSMPMRLSAMAGARVYVEASCMESIPFGAMQAQTLDIPVVATDFELKREYLGDGASFFAPNDVDQLEALLTGLPAGFPATPVDEPQKRRESYRAAIAPLRTELTGSEEARGTAAPAPQEPPKIYYDMTTFFVRHGKNPTGIARVEHMYGVELKRLLRGRLEYVRWNRQERAFYPFSFEELEEEAALQEGRQPGKDALSEWNATGEVDPRPRAPITFERDSVLVVMGNWFYDACFVADMVSISRQHDMRLVTAIYDVIPIKFPHMIADWGGGLFRNMAFELIPACSMVVTDSKCARRDILEFCREEGVAAPEVEIIPLAAKLPEVKAPPAGELDDIDSFLGGNPFVLTVSSLSPRKNHYLLYYIWIRLQEEFAIEDLPRLIIVGENGFNWEVFRDEATRDPRVRDTILILGDIEDNKLDWLYRNCLFTVYPSLYEGYGMPVAESLAYGKICLCSNEASMPEVAPEVTDLLDPLDFASWYAAMKRYLFDAHARRNRETEIRERFRPITWEGAAPVFAAALSRPMARAPLPTPYHEPGSPIMLTDEAEHAAAFKRYAVRGWEPPDEGGAWSCGSWAAIELAVPQDAGAMVLLAELSPFQHKKGSAPVHIDVYVDGDPAGLWVVQEQDFYEAKLPHSISPESQAGLRRIRIDLHIRNPRRPGWFGGTDVRLLGVKCKSLRLLPCAMLAVGRPVDLSRALVGDASWFGLRWEESLKAAVFTRHGVVGAFTTQPDGPIPEALYMEFYSLCPTWVAVELNGKVAGMSRISNTGATGMLVPIPRGLWAHSPSRANVVQLHSGIAPGNGPALRTIALLESINAYDAPIETHTPCNMMAVQDDAGLASPLLCGWGKLESGGRWTIGKQVLSAVKLDSQTWDMLNIRSKVRAFLPIQGTTQRVFAYFNGQLIDNREFKNDRSVEWNFSVPANLSNTEGLNFIEFQMEQAFSPKSLGQGEDTRELGLFFEQLTLQTTETVPLHFYDKPPEYRMGTPVTLSEDDQGICYLAGGWSRPNRRGGVWSEARRAVLRLGLRKPIPAHLEFRFRAKPLLHETQPALTTTVVINNEPVKRFTFRSQDPAQYAVRVPRGLIGNSGELIVEFRIADPRSPMSLGISENDDRDLGILVAEFSLVEGGPDSTESDDLATVNSVLPGEEPPGRPSRYTDDPSASETEPSPELIP